MAAVTRRRYGQPSEGPGDRHERSCRKQAMRPLWARTPRLGTPRRMRALLPRCSRPRAHPERRISLAVL